VTEQETLCLEVKISADVGRCRVRASNFALAMGLDKLSAARTAILASELAANIVKHAGGCGGSMTARGVKGEGGRRGIEMVFSDAGPGMNVGEAIADGFSTAGTLGIGLGSVERLADAVDIGPGAGGKGICVKVTKWGDGTESPGPTPECVAPRSSMQFGARSRPCPGMRANGDAYVVRFAGQDETLAVVIDGLGHGEGAQEAARVAQDHIERNAHLELEVLFERLHAMMRRTRGAVIGAARIEAAKGTVRFLGVGNIDATILQNGKFVSLVSLNGIVGHCMRTLRSFSHEWTPGCCLVMCSDGVRNAWRQELAREQLAGHPETLSETILAQYARSTDDATAVAVRQKS
jgi:anti-sigma regulatory factor (Ser/Thr protein kinase)